MPRRASRLRPAEALALIEENLAPAAHANNMMMSIRLVYSAVAQLPQREVLGMIDRLVETAAIVGGKFRHGVWQHIISAALSQLDPALAGRLFTHGLAQHRTSRKAFLRHAWLFVVQCAAEHLAPSEAVPAIEQSLTRVPTKDTPEEWLLDTTFEVAAARVPPDEAGELALRWLRNGLKAGKEAESRWWQSAAKAAAARASETSSGRLINSLLAELDHVSPEQVESRMWLIDAATRHVLPAEASALLSRLLSLHCEAEDTTCQSLWQSSLWHVAGCLPAPAACQLVEQVCDKATPLGPEWVNWDELASAAAERLESTDARRLHRRFDVPGSSVTTHTWLLRSLVAQSDVREDAWLCRTLLMAGHREEALRVAKRSEAVALVGSRADSSTRGDVEVRSVAASMQALR